MPRVSGRDGRRCRSRTQSRRIDRRPISWPAPGDVARRRPESTSLYAYLLDADADLAEEFDIRTRLAARQLATARVLHAAVGECDLAAWFEAVGRGPGLLILDGVVAFETRVGDRTALELVGAGDLLQLPVQRADDLLERGDAWRVLLPDAARAARRRVRRPRAALAADRPGAAAPRRPAHRRRRRAARDHLPAATRGPPRAPALAPGRALGPRRAGGHPRRAAAHPPAARPARRRPSGRRSRTPSRASAHAGLVTGTAGDLHLHGTLDAAPRGPASSARRSLRAHGVERSRGPTADRLRRDRLPRSALRGRPTRCGDIREAARVRPASRSTCSG